MLLLNVYDIPGLLRRLRRDEGQTMAEYAVILGVIAVAVIVAVAALSGGIENALNRITDLLPST